MDIFWNHTIDIVTVFGAILMSRQQKNYSQMYPKSKASLYRNLSTATPEIFFSTILWFVAVVYNSYFFQNSRFTEITRH